MLNAQDTTGHSKDLALQILPWLEQAWKLAESHNIREVAGELKALAVRYKTPGFQLAFVGEFSRGKSTLVNRLLARPLLPTRTIPTTATFTSLVAGVETEEYMEVSFSSTRKERRPLEETSWHDLLEHSLIQQGVPHVQLGLNHLWLQLLDAKIIDTPGVNDLKSSRGILVTEALSQCDAAVLVVSATLPFSLTEATFLEHHLIERHIPRVTVVVSKLDLLPEDQRARQFQTIQDRVAQIAPLISVFPAYEIKDRISESKSEVTEALRAHIEMLADKSDRRTWRSQQVAATLADHLGQLINIAQTAIVSAQVNETERKEVLRRVNSETRDAELQWGRIELEFDQRCFKVDSQLQQNLRTEQKNLQAIVDSALAQAQDSLLWWQRDFPITLRQAFLELEQKFESFLMNALSSDAQWLQEEVKRTFDIQLIQNTPVATSLISITLERREARFEDVNWKRLLIRIGAAAAAIAGALFLAANVPGFQGSQITDILGLGGSASQGVGNLDALFLGKEIEQQRQQVSQEVLRSIERSIEEYASRMSTHLRELYKQIASDMQRERRIWQTARNAALEAKKSQAETTGLLQLVDEASALQRTILAQLEKSDI